MAKKKRDVDKILGSELTYTKKESDKIFEALKRAYFLIEKAEIEDEYFEILRFGLGDLLPSQICRLEEFIRTGTLEI